MDILDIRRQIATQRGANEFLETDGAEDYIIADFEEALEACEQNYSASLICKIKDRAPELINDKFNIIIKNCSVEVIIRLITGELKDIITPDTIERNFECLLNKDYYKECYINFEGINAVDSDVADLIKALKNIVPNKIKDNFTELLKKCKNCTVPKALQASKDIEGIESILQDNYDLIISKLFVVESYGEGLEILKHNLLEEEGSIEFAKLILQDIMRNEKKNIEDIEFVRQRFLFKCI